VANQDDGSGNPFQYFEPGMIAPAEGEDVGTVENKRPSQLISLFRDMLRGDIAGGTRTSQRWIDRNYGRANYSSMRADNQDSERLVNPEQLRYGRQKFMGGLYERVWPMLASWPA
jgi:capsid protein